MRIYYFFDFSMALLSSLMCKGVVDVIKQPNDITGTQDNRLSSSPPPPFSFLILTMAQEISQQALGGYGGNWFILDSIAP